MAFENSPSQWFFTGLASVAAASTACRRAAESQDSDDLVSATATEDSWGSLMVSPEGISSGGGHWLVKARGPQFWLLTVPDLIVENGASSVERKASRGLDLGYGS